MGLNAAEEVLVFPLLPKAVARHHGPLLGPRWLQKKNTIGNNVGFF